MKKQITMYSSNFEIIGPHPFAMMRMSHEWIVKTAHTDSDHTMLSLLMSVTDWKEHPNSKTSRRLLSIGFKESRTNCYSFDPSGQQHRNGCQRPIAWHLSAYCERSLVILSIGMIGS